MHTLPVEGRKNLAGHRVVGETKENGQDIAEGIALLAPEGEVEEAQVEVTPAGSRPSVLGQSLLPGVVGALVPNGKSS